MIRTQSVQMIDYVIRNARVPGRHDAHDRHRLRKRPHRGDRAETRLRCAGIRCRRVLVLRRADRDAYPSRQVAHHRSLRARDRARSQRREARVGSQDTTFTVEDVHARAKETLENCIKHGATRMRTHVEVDPGVGMRGFEGVQALVDEYKWAIDIELCVFPQEGLTNNPGTDELMVEGLKRGAKVDRRGAGLRHRSCRADPPRVRAGARVRCRHRHASRFRQHAGRSRRACWSANLTETIQMRRPRRDRPCHQALDAGAGRGRRRCAKRLADAGVAVTILPATDLFLMGRERRLQCAARPRGREPVRRAWLQLLDLDQQHPQSVHAVRRLLAACAWRTCMPTCCRSARPSASPNASRCSPRARRG